MKCKFCNAEMDDEQKICPVCGADNSEEAPEDAEKTVAPELSAEQETAEKKENFEEAEAKPDGTDPEAEEPEEFFDEQPKKKMPAWKIVLTVLGCVVLAGVLVCAVLYGLGISLKPRPNDIFNRSAYTVSEDKAVKSSDTVIATVGDKKLTNGELQVYYQMNMVNFVNYYGAYVSALNLDPSKPLNEQIQDPQTGLTWEQFFLENSIQTWQRYASLGMLAQQDQFVLDEETAKQLDELEKQLDEIAKKGGFASVQEMVADEMGPSATAEGYMSYMRTYYESLGYYDQIFDSLQPSEEEMEAYFTSKQEEYQEKGVSKDNGSYVDVRHILLTPEGATQDEKGNLVATDEQWTACEARAQEILDSWKTGEATEKTFGDLAIKYSQDPGSAQRGGLIDQMTKGQTVKTFDAWSFDESRKSGDTGIVRSEFGVHIIYFCSSRPIWQTAVSNDMVTERTDEMLQDAMDQWPMDIKYRKIVLSRVGGDADPAETTAPVTTVPATTVPATAAAN